MYLTASPFWAKEGKSEDYEYMKHGTCSSSWSSCFTACAESTSIFTLHPGYSLHLIIACTACADVCISASGRLPAGFVFLTLRSVHMYLLGKQVKHSVATDEADECTRDVMALIEAREVPADSTMPLLIHDVSEFPSCTNQPQNWYPFERLPRIPYICLRIKIWLYEGIYIS